MTDRKRFWIFIAVAFGGGWLMQGLGMLLGGVWYQALVALGMFMPMLGVFLSHGGLKKEKTGIVWRPEIVGHARRYILAWLGPAALSIVCAALFFALFPVRFDGSMSAYLAALGDAELPFPPIVLAAISFMQAITYAPFLNMLPAVGEEAGWRGYLTPYLTKRFGGTAGLLLSGCIWGLWHAPLILLAGYEYGTGYPGAPYTGLILMCVGCAAMGILLSFLYEKAGSIWAPALAHGGLNAAAGIGVLFLANGGADLFLGPTPLGLVSGIPLYLLALWLLIRKRK